MKILLILRRSGLMLSLTFLFGSLYGQDSLAVKEILEHREHQHQEFLDKKGSPLEENDRINFKGLNYYPIDLKYRVKAKFVRTENTDLFKMKTSTTRLPEYRKYGEVYFTIDDKDLRLEVYQSPDIMKMPGYSDYLFIPFTDPTNGDETYDVGRYLEMRIPTGDEVILDFNKCYNPYCSYNSKYSCPIPPEANQLPVPILAGEKKFKDSH